jgi:hypothetical protein
LPLKQPKELQYPPPSTHASHKLFSFVFGFEFEQYAFIAPSGVLVGAIIHIQLSLFVSPGVLGDPTRQGCTFSCVWVKLSIFAFLFNSVTTIFAIDPAKLGTLLFICADISSGELMGDLQHFVVLGLVEVASPHKLKKGVGLGVTAKMLSANKKIKKKDKMIYFADLTIHFIVAHSISFFLRNHQKPSL